MLVGADIQFRIWNPVLSVLSVQDLNASTRVIAQNALTHSLCKKTAQEIQIERIKLGEYLGVKISKSYTLLVFPWFSALDLKCLFCFLQMDINEMTQPWGLEVDRVELTLGSLLKAPEVNPSGSFIMPPSVPGMEGLAGPIQQLAMHFLNHTGNLLSQQGRAPHTYVCVRQKSL